MPDDASLLAESAAFIGAAADRWINDGSNSDGFCPWCNEFTCGVASHDEYAKPHKADCALQSMLDKLKGSRCPTTLK